MTERDQYRERLQEIVWEHIEGFGLRNTAEAAEAVAAQVLRDLIDGTREKTHRYPFDVYVTLFADERGISLEDTP